MSQPPLPPFPPLQGINPPGNSPPSLPAWGVNPQRSGRLCCTQPRKSHFPSCAAPCPAAGRCCLSPALQPGCNETPWKGPSQELVSQEGCSWVTAWSLCVCKPGVAARDACPPAHAVGRCRVPWGTARLCSWAQPWQGPLRRAAIFPDTFTSFFYGSGANCRQPAWSGRGDASGFSLPETP